MGFKRVLGSGIVGMLIFIPMAYLSFTTLNLLEMVTGGLIQNVEGLTAIFPQQYRWVGFLIFGIAGVFLLNLFPVHYALINNPGDIPLLLALIIPWILTAIIIAALFAHSPTGGFTSSLAVGIGYFIIMVIIYFVIAAVGGQVLAGLDLSAVLNGVAAGMTDLPFLAAAGTAAFEGAAIGGVFGAFIGSLKYKGEGGSGKKKKSKSKEKTVKMEPSFSERSTESSSSTAGSDFCKNCGARLVPGDEFCTNCGGKA
jgi:hypothetical protein